MTPPIPTGSPLIVNPGATLNVTTQAAPVLAVTDDNVEAHAGIPGAMLRKLTRRGLRHVRQGERIVVLLDDLRAFLAERGEVRTARIDDAAADTEQSTAMRALLAAGGVRGGK